MSKRFKAPYRAPSKERELRQIAEGIPDQPTLVAVIGTLDKSQQRVMVEALRKHLRFNPEPISNG